MAELVRRQDWIELWRLLLHYGQTSSSCVCHTTTDIHERHCPAGQVLAKPHANQFTLAPGRVREPPLSRQHLLGIQLVQHASHLHPHSAWLELLPPRLGFDACTDLAALALTEGLNYHFGGRVDESHSNAALLCYDKAVTHLGNAIDSKSTVSFEDATLITVALLAMCEVMMNPHSTSRQKNVFVHWSGLKSVFLGKYQPPHVSDIARSILHNLWDCTFGISCATGTASLFDNGRWTELEPATLHGMTEDAIRLRKITNVLMIRVPGLISLVRLIRQIGLQDPTLLEKAALLAFELSQSHDEAAESSILHRVKVTKTKDSWSRSVVPYSYTFPNVDDFSAAVLYWSQRTVLINLCLALHTLAGLEFSPFDEPIAERMKSEKQRYAMNLMMSWEFAESLGPFETLWVAKGLLQNWLELRATDEFKGVPTTAVRAWALPKMNHQFNEWLSQDVSEGDMDVAANLLVGGPLVGFIAQTGSHAS